jgi:hypothetical protein
LKIRDLKPKDESETGKLTVTLWLAERPNQTLQIKASGAPERSAVQYEEAR